MMKFYVKPEIEALALETVDVIETSGARVAADSLVENSGGKVTAEVQVIKDQITEMSNDWQW